MTIAQALSFGRRAMAQLELSLVQALLDQYGLAWRHVEERLSEVEGLIEAALIRGETVDDAWLGRQQWWAETLTSIDVEMTRFTSAMASQIAGGQLTAIQTSRQVGSAVADYLAQQAAQRNTPLGIGFRGKINPGAFERWVVAQQPGSPVRQAIDRYGTRVSDSLRKHMTEGLAAGEHPRAITQRIVAQVGDDAVEGRIHTITRQETLRAYRGAAADSFAPMQNAGAIIGYRWLAALGPRTCLVCLAMHGRFFEEYPTTQHVGCRCSVQPVPSPKIIPLHPVGQTGDEWLRNQPSKTQRELLGPGRYEAFQGGTPLIEFVGTKHDDIWGDSVVLKPLREVKAA